MPDVKANLLIVDDDATVRTLLEGTLSAHGYRVRAAESGFAALAEIHTEAPDLLLSDLHMPGMSGFDLLAVVKRRFPRVRAIAMSSAYPGPTIPRGLTADAFYEKGSNLAMLLGAMEAALSRVGTGDQSTRRSVRTSRAQVAPGATCSVTT